MINIEKSFIKIGKNEKLREKFISFIKEVESDLPYKGSVRDDITKYLVDALFEKDDFVIKSIQNGLKFKFYSGIGSKVAREFLMSTPKIPEFVWEPQTTKLLLYLSSIAKTVFVGGAYFGDQVIPIADLIKKSGGVVYAFDLNEMQIEVLRQNAIINNLSNIIPELLGLWKDSKTYLDISDTDDLAFATPLDDHGKSNTITIDEYALQHSIDTIDLIMLDVEGSEFNILSGARKQLEKKKNYPNIVFEVHRSYMDWSKGLKETDLIKYLESFGYNIFSIRDFQGNYDMGGMPIELIAPEKTYIEGPSHGFNMLAVKDMSLIDNSLFRMCENVSPKYILHKDPSLHHPIGGFRKTT
jgi:FkbM family methyltransferase